METFWGFDCPNLKSTRWRQRLTHCLVQQQEDMQGQQYQLEEAIQHQAPQVEGQNILFTWKQTLCEQPAHQQKMVEGRAEKDLHRFTHDNPEAILETFEKAVEAAECNTST